MIKIVANTFEGQYAVPMEHPITCGNPAPWLIEEMKITREYDRDTGNPNFIKVWIRNDKSIWFRADQCFVCTEEECLTYMEMKNIK